MKKPVQKFKKKFKPQITLEQKYPLLHQINKVAEDGILIFDLAKTRPLSIGIYFQAKDALNERGIEFKCRSLNWQLRLYTHRHQYLKAAAKSKDRVNIKGELEPRTDEDMMKARKNLVKYREETGKNKYKKKVYGNKNPSKPTGKVFIKSKPKAA